MNRIIGLNISLFRDGPSNKQRVRTFLEWYEGYYRDTRFSFDAIYPTTLSSQSKKTKEMSAGRRAMRFRHRSEIT